jgi:hypothetical protein
MENWKIGQYVSIAYSDDKNREILKELNALTGIGARRFEIEELKRAKTPWNETRDKESYEKDLIIDHKILIKESEIVILAVENNISRTHKDYIIRSVESLVTRLPRVEFNLERGVDFTPEWYAEQAAKHQRAL